jgi:streptogramin lyase
MQRGFFTAIEYGADHIWLADYLSNRILQVHPETAEIIRSFAIPGIQVDGMAFDGVDLWLSDATTLTIYQVDTTGAILRSFLSPGQSPKGLTHDGFYLWNVDGYQKIYQLKIRN